MVSLTTFFHFSKKDKVEYRGVPMHIPPSKPQRPSDVVDDCQDSRKSEIPEIRGSAEIRDTGRGPPQNPRYRTQRPSDVVDDCQDSRKSEIPEI